MGLGNTIKQWVRKSLSIEQAGGGSSYGGGYWTGGNSQVPVSRFRTPQQQQEAYTSVSHVYSCVSLIAANMAGLPYHLLDKQGNDIEQSPLIDLLERPSETITYPEFIEALVTYLELNGNGYIYLDYGGGRIPRGLYVLDSARVRPVWGNTGLLGFVFNRGNAGLEPILPEAMIHIKYNRPGNPYYGLGPVEALGGTLDNELSMLDANRASFANGTRPSGILMTEDTLNDSEFQALKAQFEQQYQGVKNFNKPIVLQDGLKFQATAMSPVETALVDQRKFSRDDILSGFGVPAPMLGIIENANYKMDTALRIFWQITMTPKVQRLEAAMTKLAQMFGVASFELEMPDTQDTTELAQAIGQLQRFGAPITDDEYRAMLNLPPLQGGMGASIWRPINQQQVGTAPVDTAGQTEVSTPLLDAPKSMPPMVRRAARKGVSNAQTS